MSIIRSPRPDSNFYILDKSISEDETLSWAARGLLVFLLGKPDNWRISVEHLKQQTQQSAKPTGRDGIYSLLMELMNAGYMRRTAARDDMGKMAGYDYFVSETRLFDSPRKAEPVTDSPCPAEPYTAETTLISTEVKQGLSDNNTRAKRSPVHITVDDLVKAGVAEQHAIDWMAIRNKKRAPLTRTAAEALAREAAKAGLTIPQAVQVCAERGWQSLKAEWLTERKTAQQQRADRNAKAFDYDYQMKQLEGM